MSIIDTSKDLNALFSQQVRSTPHAVALQDKDVTYTYAQLDEKVIVLATRFRQQLKVGRDTLVGILLQRCADYVISSLAALRAGAAFLVLELAYPTGLLANVIADAKPVVIVTHSAHADSVKQANVPIMLLDQPDNLNLAPSHTSLPFDNDQADLEKLAFVSYSSGTTGKPKGIANPHRAPVNSYNLRFAINDLQPGDRVACNVYFIWEMLRPLLRGATTVAVPDEASYDPVALTQLLAKSKITETLMTPTLLAALLARHANLGDKLPDLRSLWLNGEVVTTDLAKRAIKALPNVRLLNCYSASETHEVACGDIKQMLLTLDKDAPYCPVGPPMDPQHTYILDQSGNKVEPGGRGELFVGGSLLARGYLNLAESTARAFTKDAFASQQGARKYSTGDLARIIPESGLLEITGRVGGMVKIRGFSIVPATVEKAIIDNFAVSNCAVVAHGDALERQLVAYIVRDQAPQEADRTVLTIDESGYSPVARQTLTSILAHYMIPTLWVLLESLPTHPVSGKVDLKNLPSPAAAIAAANAANRRSNNASPSPDEMVNIQSIARLWAVSLNMSPQAIIQVGKTVSFFDLGGHSLSLADLASRISKTMGSFTVPLAKLAGSPTLEGHVQVVLNARDGHNAAVQADLPAILKADSVLDDTFKPSGAPMRRLSEADMVLLTGTTGFLGGFLLHDILKSTCARIICLIRFNQPYRTDASAAMARLRRNMLDLGLWDNSMLDRIDVLPANLSRNRLGLLPQVYEDLASKVQVIVHCAAQVNLVYPYAALRDANVEGTREILRLACLSNATVQYVSTNGVLAQSESKGWSEDTMMPIDQVPEKLLDGYCQTKWVAEQLVLEAARRGLAANVVRIGTLAGHSETGTTNTYDLITALIVESLHLGVSPELEGWNLEMTAVDFVSKGIVALSNHNDPKQHVYHLGETNPIDCRVVFEHLEALGYPTKRTDWDSWVALWHEKRGGAKGGDHGVTVDILRSGMPEKEFLVGVVALNDEATKPALGGLERPKMDAKLLQTYARHWYARGWLHRQPSSIGNGVAAPLFDPNRPLASKVAIITGASSGIGAAVAKALAREGAHVSLAARRIDALESLKSDIAKVGGGKVYIHKTDVTDRSQVDSLIRSTASTLGPIDMIISCAGVMYFTLMKNLKIDEWEQTVDVNCKGLLNVLSSSLPHLLSREASHFVAISSDAGRKVFPGLGVYSASKFFVEATLQSLRLETAGTGLRVTSIQPGNTATDLLGMSSDEEAVKQYGEASGAKILEAQDVANTIVYALRLPHHVAVNEVLIEPREEPI